MSAQRAQSSAQVMAIEAHQAAARLKGFALDVRDGHEPREIFNDNFVGDLRQVAANPALAMFARRDLAQVLPPDIHRELGERYPALAPNAATIHEAEPDAGWPKPINLFRGIAAQPLSIEDAPSVISEYAVQFALAGGFDPTGAIVAGVVAVAAAIDDGIRLLLPGASGHFQAARLWGAVIGSPGSGKSPMQRSMLAPIHAIHRELIAQNERDRVSAGHEDPSTPVRALFTSDCTVDKMTDLLTHNARGILYSVDELDSWLGQHEAFGRESGGRNRGEWMRLYDGGPHQVDRVKRGSYFVKNWGASVLTATTSAALKRLARKLSADGLFQRFMVFAVAPMRDRDRNVHSLAVDSARRAYDARIRAIYAHSADLIEQPVVRLSADAAALYEAEERRLRLLVESAESINEGFAAHVAKHAGMLARVALTFHAASDELLSDNGEPRHPCAANVSASTIRRSIRFMRRAYQHAFTIYTECLGASSPMDMAKAMARSILADEFMSFNRREMTHTCRAFRAATEWQRTEAMRTLEDFGWIEGEALLPEHGGRWTVNPQVHELFAEERERARERRAFVRSALHLDGGLE
jgi:hypothetical protein